VPRLPELLAVKGADSHPHVLRRLRRDLPGHDWIAHRGGELPADVPCLEVATTEELPEGAFSLAVESEERRLGAVRIEGGPVSGVIYGVDELIRRVRRRQGEVEAGAVRQSPRLPHRTLWTWDHSTNWYLEQVGLQEIGAMNVYSKPPDGFLEDYRRLVDFMSDHRLPAVTVYGLLRDSHGGIEAAQELCRYAWERGVRIIAGVGINAYGGVYWEGDHRYNLSTWLRRNPDLSAQLRRDIGFEISDVGPLHFPATEYAMAACPSRPQNAAFHREAVEWLAETLDLGGMNLETGDYGVCECDACRSRRSPDGSWSLSDMADLYPQLFSAARAASERPLWLYCEVYWDNVLDLDVQAPLRSLPDDAIYQYCVNRSYWPRVRNHLDGRHVDSMPHSTNVLRTHMGTQWNQERYSFVGRDFADMNGLAIETGMAGSTIFGEVSSISVPNELNYLAFAESAYDEDFSWDAFTAAEIDPRLGGQAASSEFWSLLAGTQETRDTRILQVMLRRASEGAAGLTGEPARRWLWLQERIARREFAFRE
jgi:hypothetical protein